MAKLVLSDASPLIILARVDGLTWLHVLFGKVLLPRWVHSEVITGDHKPGEAVIQQALDRGWLEVLDRDWPSPVLPMLGEGEAACIRAALNLQQPCLILMDERAGREVAKEQGIAVTGVAGIIGMAKNRGLIVSATDVFEQLLQENFRLSAEVIRAVLVATGERSS